MSRGPAELTPDRYVELLRADADRLALLAQRDLAAAVPTCPGWNVRDALVHTGHVYQHKVANMRTMARAEFGEEPAPEGGEIEWFRAALDELVAELVSRGPDAAAYTWYPEDQTVGFWFRRMAHETAVHRVDVESAFDQVTAIAEDLAVDGIDELLELFLGGEWDPDDPDWGDVSRDAGAGTTTAVSAGGRSWWITLQPDRIDVTGEERAAEARVTGPPSDVLLWLWGRLGDDALSVEGDTAVLQALRDRLTIAGQ